MRKTLSLTVLVVILSAFSSVRLPAVEAPHNSVNEPAAVESISKLTRANFEFVAQSLYDSIGLSAYELNFDIFRKALVGYFSLASEDALKNKELLTIINFEQPSTEKRFYTIDLASKVVKFHTYVAHGRNTGENLAKKFSNTLHSNQSSLGFVVTGETYYGSKGYSLRLDGKERSINDNVRNRAVVIHGADYVTESWIKRYGRLGRSQGCPALPPDLNKEIIDTIKGGTAIFSYYPETEYFKSSAYVNDEDLFRRLDSTPIALAGILSPSSSQGSL